MVYIKLIRLLCIGIAVLISVTASANIEVTTVKHSSFGLSNGSITIQLGDASPFDIVIEQIANPNVLVIESYLFEGSSYSTPEDLPPGDYKITVTSHADSEDKQGGCQS